MTYAATPASCQRSRRQILPTRRIDLDQLPDDVRESAAPRPSLPEAVDRFERAHIALVLRLCEGNREKAAEELGISPATLYRRLERLGLKGR
jgi:DNA-binding NtrC family response regulator